MFVEADPQVVGDPLTDAGGEIIINVGCHRGNDGDKQGRQTGEQRDPDRVASDAVAMRPGEPIRQFVVHKSIVENQLERPRCGKAHRDLRQHRDEYDHQPGPVRPNELKQKTPHLFVAPAVTVGLVELLVTGARVVVWLTIFARFRPTILRLRWHLLRSHDVRSFSAN